jgi:long-chain acyl-CoA synthetase
MAETILRRFLDTAKRNPTKTALRFPQSRATRQTSWLDLNWHDYYRLVASLAAGLQATGVRKGDRVAIMSDTRVEWAALDLAVLGIGAITVPIYPSSTVGDINFILQDSQAKVLFVEDVTTLMRVQSMLRSDSQIRRPEKFILIDSNGRNDNPLLTQTSSLDELQTLGERALKSSPSIFELAVDEVSSKDIATIVYTSGTTGCPKGVVHTHTQLFSEVSEALPLLGITSSDVTLSFLPYAHILGRIEIWGHALLGYTMGFAVSIDQLKAALKEIRPTVIVAVPRIFEKIYSGIIAHTEISPLRRKIFARAMSAGREVSRCKQEKRAIPLDVALQYAIARKLIFREIQERLGGRLRFAVSGGAPLSREISEFFHAAGILILDGYGLTETTAAICVNTPFDYRFGTVGKPIGDVKIKIADDGEILVKSRKVMREYWEDPSSTFSALKDGWLHTGDIGEFDESGHLRITDRKKDLIKTAGGKYVAPQRIESLIKLSQFVGHVHIHGDRKKYCIALVTLNWEHVLSWAKEQGLQIKSLKQASENPKVQELIRSALADANSQLATFETVKHFAILPHDFSIENGELTPSLKVKRKVVDERYKDIIDSLY